MKTFLGILCGILIGCAGLSLWHGWQIEVLNNEVSRLMTKDTDDDEWQANLQIKVADVGVQLIGVRERVERIELLNEEKARRNPPEPPPPTYPGSEESIDELLVKIYEWDYPGDPIDGSDILTLVAVPPVDNSYWSRVSVTAKWREDGTGAKIWALGKRVYVEKLPDKYHGNVSIGMVPK